MGFFQNSVLDKHLKTLDKQVVMIAYAKFKEYFHNPAIQDNIRSSKEEQFQEGFLRELFVKILGYTLNPTANYNLTTEYKNIKDSKKADGAILLQGAASNQGTASNQGVASKQGAASNQRAASNQGAAAPWFTAAPIVIAVIELKGTDTTDLSKIENQAFGYKNNQPECVYVITSNFEKLRFYIDNAIEYIEFNLFNLTENDFEILYLCLAYENIENGIPKKIKEESVSQEDVITKKLYNDYSLFKRELYQILVALNPQFDALILFKKSQKLLDRFLFLFFAEDRQLLPPNSVRLILNDWRDLQERDVQIPLYDRFKKYFEYLNTGYKGKRYDVYAYNGGLFKPDEILDCIKIDDELLFKRTLKLSEYDFASEVDVNILGHIFENSLNELDEIKAQLEGQEIDKSKSKRKREGIFYTPKYITKYIVDNTVGKLCTEKKAELLINEEDFITDKKRQKKTKQELVERLADYRKWLLQITICDPACGSGAFLNQALDNLISEHRYIDELEAKILGYGLILSDIEKSILENNLFGVDLNEESVEIAKLSLWLRTAQPNRKLNDLNKNIKCGNSLIDDPKVAYEKAFNWQKEFPNVFKIKEKTAHHITWATHNSRTSQRMIDYNVKKGETFWLEPEYEILITKTIADIVTVDHLNVMAYNICGDHVHTILICEDEEVPNIVRKLKGKSSQKLKEYLQIPKEEQFTLWTQKFGNTHIDSEEQLWNTVEYIKYNREKHQLQHNKGLQPLVDTICCDYDHAYRTEYKGGFDVVIGNPPWGASFSTSEKEYLLKNYLSKSGEAESSVHFIDLSFHNLLSYNGILSFITPNTWFYLDKYETIRKALIDFDIKEMLELEKNIFEDAPDIVPVIFFIKKSKETKEKVKTYKLIKGALPNNITNIQTYISNQIEKNNWRILDSLSFNLLFNNETCSIIKKISLNQQLLSVYKVRYGIKTGDNKRNLTKNINCNENWKYCLPSASAVKRYSIIWEGDYLNFGIQLSGFSNNSFEKPKIVIQYIRKISMERRLICAFDYEGKYYPLNNFSFVESISEDYTLEYLITLLNSNLLNFYFKNCFIDYNIKPRYIEKLPIPSLNIYDQQPFIEKANLMLSLNKELDEASQKFQRTIQRKFDLEDLPNKLQDWYLLSFAEFIKELGKKKIKLSLSQEAEWEDYFLQESKIALEVKSKIEAADKAIDQMVYELYGLTAEEIAIVESSTNTVWLTKSSI